MEIIKALPVSVCSINTQIIQAGGDGFNCDVNIVKSATENDFGSIFEFRTKDGLKRLELRNEFSVGQGVSDTDDLRISMVFSIEHNLFYAYLFLDRYNVIETIPLSDEINFSKAVLFQRFPDYNFCWFLDILEKLNRL